MADYISPIDNDALSTLCEELLKNNRIYPEDYRRFDVKRGLRNADGTGVMTGLTRICSVEGYYIDDGERVPKDGRLVYRGIDMSEIVKNCQAENRFGFEEVAWLLLFGDLPTQKQLDRFSALLAECRELPDEFIEDMIMKAPSPDIMNKVARSVLALYSFDENPDDVSVGNVLRQSIQLIAQIPTIMAYAYQVKRRAYDHKSMYIHQNDKSLKTAESILHSIRSDRKFTDEEAKLLDICMIIHAEHGGGNNSSFTTHVVTSAHSDLYSSVAASILSLKGSRHGGANLRVMRQIDEIKSNVKDWRNSDAVAKYLERIADRKAGDGSGLIYGLGHAVYTVSDPRAQMLKAKAEALAREKRRTDEMKLFEAIEELGPAIVRKRHPRAEDVCANVDLYSGFVYDMLGIPKDLYTPLFAVARCVSWCAHRMEELVNAGPIIRPAYKPIFRPRTYVPLKNRR